ncbi:MAG: helix-turn-helix domain-containing protein [Acidimicrobiales bacterium]
MKERTPNKQEQEALDDLTFALRTFAGLHVDEIRLLDRPAAVDLLVDTDRGVLAVEVKSKPSAESIWAAVGRWQFDPIEGAIPMMVAEWFPAPALDALNRVGWSWYDRRRGRLHLGGPAGGTSADYHVPPAERTADEAVTRRDPLASAVGKELAVHLLLLVPEREQPGSFREIARDLGRSVSSVHAAMAALKDDGLVTHHGVPVRSELFDALARAWRPRVISLAGLPGPGSASVLDRAPEFNPFDPTRPGWALTDTRAAAAWGAPVVASGAYPPDFYVPSRRALRWAVQQYGAPPTFDQRAATVAVAPVAVVCSLRYDPAALSELREEEFLLAHPLFVALDLARDAARGREILTGWDPNGPGGFRRAW